MILIDRLLTGGLGFVLDQIATAVDAEMNDGERVRQELLAAQMENELGELSDEDFAELERDLLARLRTIRDEQRGAREGAVSGISSVEVSFDAGRRDE